VARKPSAPPGTRDEAPLARYAQKRDFQRTSEPPAVAAQPRQEGLRYVIQKHWASRLHYDFRLELDGVLLSWAVPKGPSLDPREKRMAVRVEDHPVSYGSFEGTIPPKQYGAGTVIVWDRGTWEPVGDARDGIAQGKLVFALHGEKLAGRWELVRIAKPGDKQDPWMLFKKRDAWARPLAEYDVIAALPDSVVERPLGPIEEREPRDASARTPPASRSDEPPDLANAVKAALPAQLEPQLATLAASAPPGGDWVIETKFDGYRLMARIDRGKARLITRGGHDWSDKMPSLAKEIESLGTGSAWLDGEIVVLNAQGVPDFNALQNAIDTAHAEPIVYFVFDAPFLGGRDMRRVPLWARRAALKALFDERSAAHVRFSQSFDAPVAQVLDAACRMSLEGVMLKRADAPYVSTRSETWLKLKCTLRQEFVVCGFTDRHGAASEVGGLLLGYHENGALRYAGNVGTGWDAATGRKLHATLVTLETDQPPLDPATVKPGRWSKRAAGTERWVKPRLVAEVAFTEWTPEGHIRHGSFVGLRADKPAGAITREAALAGAVDATAGRGPASSVKVTNPERVIDPSTGLRKLDLVRYYESIAERMLPHLKDRPVSLVRAPDGIGGELFFQKHPETRMPGLTELAASLWPGHAALLSVGDAQALVAAAQMNVVEFHTWNSTVKRIDQPDRVIFDLDPGEGVSWAHVLEAALLTRTLLQELALESWLKTSGGKGLHVVVPLAPKLDYEVVKGFSQAMVQHLARTIPSRFVAKSGAANRVGKIFVDYLRNGHAQTTAAAFSARARPGLGVSMPVSWEQLMALKSGSQWNITTAREYLSFEKTDPWAGLWKKRQTLTAAMKRLGYVAAPSA
jgi:bifunctional non-homologous end joining protein LigD